MAAATDTGASVEAPDLFRLSHMVRHTPAKPLAPTGRPGGHAGTKRGNGLEIVDTRLQVDGDDVRHIDAMTTARTGKPHVRTFRDERERERLLVADLRPAMLFGTRTRLRSVACAQALAISGWQASLAGGRVGLVALGPGEPLIVSARARERGMAAVCGGLAAAHAEALANAAGGALADPDLAPALERLARLAPRGASLVLATALDAPGPDFDAVLGGLARRLRVTVVLLRDAFERRAPRGAYPFLSGGIAGAAIRWAFVDRETNRPDPRVERLRRLDVDLVLLDTDATPTRMAETLGGRHADAA
ncbi:DUF58 domain-containing protein [Aurantimonas sp. Leaf443]|uniref:DUF58 domain-containing protein n=1 Tax=Aurantimonas sp. Leaf443 TaxID=1736378 RepID=UPI0006FF93EF|nr:DUF58 domain-containing protein [Aurantimonas sp. Leaf443]KQT82185.1 hypothetical protein ASG48_16230 [Aurantimonas sp. Leaf443]